MRSIANRIISILVAICLILPLASCGDDKKKACELHTEEFLSVMLARKYRLVRILTDLSDGYISSIQQIAADEYIDAVMEKATYTIEKDSIQESEKKASCTCILLVPDYESALSSSDGSLESFTAEIQAQEPEKYQTYKFDIKFRIEEGYWVVTSAETIYQDLFLKMHTILENGKIPVISDKDIDDKNLYFIIPSEGVTVDSFKMALRYTGDDAHKDCYDADKSKAGADPYLTCYAYSSDSKTVYQYYSFPSVQMANEYFSDVYFYYNRGTSHEKNKKDNWGFFLTHYEDNTAAYWFWFDTTIVLVETQADAESKKAVYRFFSALKVTG
ncbi:MAG: hypothetical protein IKG93_11325 [Clostridiales bacterium]|nr:hypothetical protein [Clostridiales bacterium]